MTTCGTVIREFIRHHMTAFRYGGAVWADQLSELLQRTLMAG